MHEYEVRRFRFTKNDLTDVPEDQLRFLLFSAKLLNELNMLTRLSFIQSNSLGPQRDKPTEPERAEQECQTAQVMYFLKLLASTIWEGWCGLERVYFTGAWSKTHTMALDQRAANALRNLKSDLSRKSILSTIRNKTSFHLDADFLMDEYLRMDDAHSLSAVVASDNANTLFIFAEEVSNRAVLVEVSEGRVSQDNNMDQLLLAILRFAKLFGEFLVGAILVTLVQHAPGALTDESSEELKLEDRPSICEIVMPYLVRPHSSPRYGTARS